jgi:TRAP-type mannitol/chloroaromatic compound transport system substrate-binding protein
MQRRKFLTSAGLGLAGTGALALSGKALAQAPEIKWRLASSFPKSLDAIYGAAEIVSKRVAAATGGKFTIQVFAAGEIVPGPGVLDAVKDGTVQMGHSASYYFIGKDPTFAFDTAIPFGLNSRQQTAWMYDGGGLQLMREFFKDYNIYNIPCGNTGAQMGGWYRKEIKTVADLKGLKFRVGGFAGQVLAKLGVVPQQIPGGDIYPALEKGTIDAAEWIGPYDDEKLGFNKVAKYYYYPGWWEGGPQLSAYINMGEWAKLPKEYQSILESACWEAHIYMQARYDAKNPAALKRLVAGGTKLMPFSNEIMAACYKAALELYDETAAKNPKFKKIYEPWKKFRDEQIEWFSVCEGRFDNFSAATVRAGQAKAAPAPKKK